jgi:hypothetical protein
VSSGKEEKGVPIGEVEIREWNAKVEPWLREWSPSKTKIASKRRRSKQGRSIALMDSRSNPMELWMM